VKLNKNRGFTLLEILIVVAICSVTLMSAFIVSPKHEPAAHPHLRSLLISATNDLAARIRLNPTGNYTTSAPIDCFKTPTQQCPLDELSSGDFATSQSFAKCHSGLKAVIDLWEVSCQTHAGSAADPIVVFTLVNHDKKLTINASLNPSLVANESSPNVTSEVRL